MKTVFHPEIILIIIISLISCEEQNDEFWVRDCEKENLENCGFIDTNGEVKIEYGKYQMIFTDTFKNYAIVLKDSEGFIGIDKDERALFKVFIYDNGPDYVSENFFRIVKDEKIGFVDYETGEIVIEPRYSGARPFERGYSAVCKDCKIEFDGEHYKWIEGKWGLVDRTGKVIIEPQFDEIKSIDTDNRITIIEDEVEKQIEIKRTQ